MGSNSVSRASKSEEKQFSGRLPFRTKPETHQRIYQASQRQNSKSINAWMERTLLEAANEVLGIEGAEAELEIGSPTISHLLNSADEQTAEWFGKMISEVLDHLEKRDPLTIIRFNSALKKLLIGVDAVRSLSGEISDKNLAGLLDEICPHQSVDALMAATLGILICEDETLDLNDLCAALKRLAAGVRAIYPMVKAQNRPHHISQIFTRVSAALRELESAV